MASKSVSTFLTRFRRDKSKERGDPTYRHSAPVPHNFDYTLDPHPQRQKQQLPAGLSEQQQQSKSKQQKQTSPNTKAGKNDAKKEAKRGAKKSKGISFLLCMSRNGDTLERSPANALPENPNKNRKSKEKIKNKHEAIPENEIVSNSDAKQKSKNGKAKLPAKGWFSVDSIVPPDFLLTTEPAKENAYGPMYQPARGPSQGVKYRVDGTLEKPYVFPSGFTFGPDGRKLQLRRSTPDFKQSKKKALVKGQAIQADVHIPDSDSGEFDAGKAFYLKFDSDEPSSSQRSSYRHSMPAVPESYFINSEDVSGSNPNFDSKTNTLTGTKGKMNSTSFRDVKRPDAEGVRESRRYRKKNRYSMPPKNEEYVYMGSFENLHLCDSLEKRQNLENERLSHDDPKKKSTTNRYSMPAKNPDCVYMGSFENIFFRNSGDKDKGNLFSLPKDETTSSDSRSRESSFAEGSKREGISQTKNNRSANVSSKSNISNSVDELSGTNRSSSFTPKRKDSSDGNSKTGITPSVMISPVKKATALESEDDFFDVSLPSEKSPRPANPFSRAGGRSSCMPGNKRTVAPPAACFDSTSVQSSLKPTSVQSSLKPSESSSIYLNGVKFFQIPPPPNYTPPWEEMEVVQARLVELNGGCHKGSQADISFDSVSLNMEDRDMSLNILDAKTIPVVIPSQLNNAPHFDESQKVKAHTGNISTSPTFVKNYPGFRDKHILSPKSPRSVLNESRSSQGSDSVFEHTPHRPPSQCLKPDASNRNSSPCSSNAYEYIYLCSSSKTPVITIPELKNPENLNNNGIKLNPLVQDGSETTRASIRNAVVTSTPKSVRRPQTEAERKSAVGQPVPSPRKRISCSSPDVANGNLTNGNVLTSVNIGDVDATNHKKAPPVPKKRQNLSYSSSSCSQGDTNLQLRSVSGADPTDRNRHSHIASVGPATRLQRSDSVKPYMTTAVMGPTATITLSDTAHIYEDVDIEHALPRAVTPAPPGPQHYEECGSLTKTGTTENEYFYLNMDPGSYSGLVSPLQTLQLRHSPQSRRRKEALDCLSIGYFSPSSPRPFFTGLSSSTCDLDTLEHKDHDYSNWMVRPFLATAEDETCAADDELSGCNDDDEEDTRKVKTKSLKKWKSADDIIRSGSIVDRSMILAKRRRLRMRDRTSKPLMFSSTETDEGEAPKAAFRHKLLPADPKNNKHYVKSPNVGKSQPANPQLNHTDSGHDSDTLSPCSSPYRKVVIGSVLDRQVSASEQTTLVSKRQTSVVKKPWENRLQNLQWVRKSRLNDNIQVESRSSLV